jgi:hypothetical protein
MSNLPIPELVENRRRSIAMLPAGAPALNPDDALDLLEQLKAALEEADGSAKLAPLEICGARQRCGPRAASLCRPTAAPCAALRRIATTCLDVSTLASS